MTPITMNIEHSDKVAGAFGVHHNKLGSIKTLFLITYVDSIEQKSCTS